MSKVTDISTLRATLLVLRKQNYTVEEAQALVKKRFKTLVPIGHIQALYREFTRKERDHELHR